MNSYKIRHEGDILHENDLIKQLIKQGADLDTCDHVDWVKWQNDYPIAVKIRNRVYNTDKNWDIDRWMCKVGEPDRSDPTALQEIRAEEQMARGIF